MIERFTRYLKRPPSEASVPKPQAVISEELTSDPVCLEIVRRLQLTTPYQQRELVARQVAEAVNATVESAGIAAFEPNDPALASRLAEDGCASLGQLLPDGKVDEVLAFLSQRTVVGSHVAPFGQAGMPDRTAAQATDLPHISYPLNDVMLAPHLLELANSNFLLGLAQSYLGCTPTLYSLNLMIAHPNPNPTPYLQSFHRDFDDFRFITLFVFLSDIERDEDGAHVFIRGSQRLDKIERRAAELSHFAGRSSLSLVPTLKSVDLFFDDRLALFPPGQGSQEGGVDLAARRYLSDWEIRIKGPRGTALLADTYGLHKGIAPTTGRRMVFWARYGLYANLAYGTMKMAPLPWSMIGHRLPDDARSRYVNRLLLA
jgi:hypothetical protein